MMKKLLLASGIFALVFSNNASAASVLHAYSGGDPVNHMARDIPAILTGDGHTVTSITDRTSALAALGGDLSSYDVVIADTWGNIEAAESANLTTWVSGGGRYLHTGYDTLWGTSTTGILGGAGAWPSDTTQAGTVLDPVANVANSLTTGVVDIRGLTPVGVSSATNSQDLDSLNGFDGATTPLVTSTYGTHWSLRTLGSGEAAWVSSPYGFSYNDDPAYNGALRNFVANAPLDTAVPEPNSVLALLPLVILVFRRQRRV